MKPIAVFYHCLLAGPDGHLVDNAITVVKEQMDLLIESGLPYSEMHVGVNGGEESEYLAQALFPRVPGRHVDHRYMHGLQCRNECRTIIALEEWLPGHPDWDVLYFHSKGATHPPNDERSRLWRSCMMSNLVWNWERCVIDLNRFDSVGCHWMSGKNNPVGNSIWAGNFWWATSRFLRTLPSINKCARIRTRQSELDSVDTRFEAEVWIGNGPRLPVVRDYHPGCPYKCTGA